MAASSKPGEIIADNLWVILGTYKGKEPAEDCIGNGVYGLIHMGICEGGGLDAPSSNRSEHEVGNRMETLAWFLAMGDCHHQLVLIRYILELHFIYDEWTRLNVAKMRGPPSATTMDQLLLGGRSMASSCVSRVLDERHRDFLHMFNEGSDLNHRTRGNDRWRQTLSSSVGQSLGNSSSEDQGDTQETAEEEDQSATPKGHIFTLDEANRANDKWIEDWDNTHSRGIVMDRWKAHFSADERDYFIT